MREIIEGSYLDYVFLFGNFRTAYSDKVVKDTKSSGGAIYITFEDKAPVGYICFSNNFVTHAFAVPEKRNTKIFHELLEYVIGRGDVQIKIPDSQPDFEKVRRTCKTLGFSQEQNETLFKSDLTDEIFGERWIEYTNRTLNKFNEILLRQGFSCIPFKDAPTIFIEQLRHSKENYFDNPFYPPEFLDSSPRNFDEDLSFMAIKDNQVVAYSFIGVLNAKSAIIRQIATAKNFLNSGCIILPMSYSVAAVRNKNFSSLFWVTDKGNEESNFFREKFSAKVTCRQSRLYEFKLARRIIK